MGPRKLQGRRLRLKTCLLRLRQDCPQLRTLGLVEQAVATSARPMLVPAQTQLCAAHNPSLSGWSLMAHSVECEPDDGRIALAADVRLAKVAAVLSAGVVAS